METAVSDALETASSDAVTVVPRLFHVALSDIGPTLVSKSLLKLGDFIGPNSANELPSQ